MLEAEDLDRSELALALGDVRVGQREDHGEAQRRSEHDNHIDHSVYEREGAREVAHELGRRRDGQQPLVAGKPVGKVDLRRGVAVQVGKKPVLLALLCEAALVGRLAHVHRVAEVVGDDAVDLDVRLGEGRVLHVDDVARAEAQHLLGALCDGAARVVERDLGARGVAEPHVSGGVHAVGEHIERHGLRGVAVAHGELVDADALQVAHLFADTEVVRDGVEVGGAARGHKVVADGAAVLAVLALRQREDRVADAEAADEQRDAARDAEDRHEEAALVTENVARCDLVEKAQATPDGADALEQDAAAGLRGLRAHERGGRLAELLHAGRGRGADDAEHEERDCGDRVDGIEVVGERRQRVHRREDREDNRRQHDEPDEIADDPADQARRARVGDVFGQDAVTRVAERLVQADEPAFLLDHARHGGQRDQDRHHKENDGQHRAQDLDARGVGLDR